VILLLQNPLRVELCNGTKVALGDTDRSPARAAHSSIPGACRARAGQIARGSIGLPTIDTARGEPAVRLAGEQPAAPINRIVIAATKVWSRIGRILEWEEVFILQCFPPRP
jgi:hypothetical protein